MSLSTIEFDVLRRTIASRGTARMVLFVITVIAWASVATVVAAGAAPAIGTLFSLLILIAGFESVHALHVGVERIGRYLRVFYEDAPDGPRWETMVSAVGPALPGGGIDPLFTLVFAAAAIANCVPLLALSSSRATAAFVGILHMTFLVRLVRARRAAARQRAADLETFRALQAKTTASV